jgi:alpha-N-arabinofuranosidase
VKTIQRAVLATFVAVSVLWLGAALALGQILDETHGAPDQTVHLRVHAGELQSGPIPATIFGSFLEPIGHSTYGGLWSELLENASFEEGLLGAGAVANMIKERPELERASQLDLPLPWEPLDTRQGNRYEPQSGDAANSSNSLLLMGLPNGEVGVRQRIYLPVHRILAYRGSIFVKHQSGPAKVYLSLRERNNPQLVFADTTIDAASQEWTKILL